MSEFSYLYTPRTIPYSYKTITQVFNEITSANPDREIFIHRGFDGTRESLTCHQLQTQATKIAGYITGSGIKKGDTVALFGPNTLEWVIAELAIIMAGGSVVQVPFDILDAREVFEIISNAECRAFFIDPGKHDEYLDMILQLKANIVEHTAISDLVLLRKSRHITSYDDLPGVLLSETGTDDKFPTLYPEDEIAIFTTSGSTGKPKMIPKTHFQFINDLWMSTPMKSYNDRPFTWMGGSPIRTICLGEPRVFCDSSVARGKHNTMRIWNIIKEEQCTSASLLLQSLSDLVAHKQTYKDSFKLDMVSAGGLIVDNFYTKVVGVFTKEIAVAYGATEVFTVSLLSPITTADEMKNGDVGKPLPGIEVKIIDQEGSVLRKGENGELCVRKIGGFEKYFKNMGSPDQILLPGNWYRSGDIAQINEDNHIIIKGRVTDYISRGTRKILPSSIEEIIMTKNRMRNVVVFGVPDRRLYEEVCVCYVTDPDHEILPADVKEFCREKLVGHDDIDGFGQMPKYFLQFQSLPMLLNGKVNKRQLIIEAIQQLGLSD